MLGSKSRKQLYNIDVESLLQIPANVYWVDAECRVLGFNPQVADLFGLAADECIGFRYDELKVIDTWTEGQASSFQNDDIEVMSTKQPKVGIIEPLLPHPDGRIRQYITTRSPLLNHDGKIVGVFGISIDTINFHYLQPTLTNNLKLNFSAISSSAKSNLTKRQTECLYYLVRGKTAKQIAKILNISYRTVEDYLDHIKLKLKCENRSDLICKAIEMGFGSIT